MPLVAAAICPHPPMLVPAVASGAAAELAKLRSACDAAVARLAAAAPDGVLVLGSADRTGWFAPPASRGSLARFGVELDVPLMPDSSEGEANLPLSLTIGAWLLGRRPLAAPVAGAAIAADATVAQCAELAGQIDDRWERVALLVMGDGSACRGEKSPGYDDPRARPYDDAVAAALADVDTHALLALDAELSAELLVAGRAPWQVLAAAARAAGPPWRGERTYYRWPYGVAYFVASWVRP